jgi:hypothetical protein
VQLRLLEDGALIGDLRRCRARGTVGVGSYRARMGETLVFGEELDDLATELPAMDMRQRADGSAQVEFRLAPGSAFLRALRLAEIELLLDDHPRARQEETRQYEAFLMVVDRIGEAARSSST